MENGEPGMDVLHAERMSLDELMAAARQQGFERFSDIRLAVLEANGKVSFFHADRSDGSNQEKSPGRSGSQDTPSVG